MSETIDAAIARLDREIAERRKQIDVLKEVGGLVPAEKPIPHDVAFPSKWVNIGCGCVAGAERGCPAPYCPRKTSHTFATTGESP